MKSATWLIIEENPRLQAHTLGTVSSFGRRDAKDRYHAMRYAGGEKVVKFRLEREAKAYVLGDD